MNVLTKMYKTSGTYHYVCVIFAPERPYAGYRPRGTVLWVVYPSSKYYIFDDSMTATQIAYAQPTYYKASNIIHDATQELSLLTEHLCAD